MSATNLLPALPNARRSTWPATIVFASLAYFVASIAALHLLRPDLDPIAQPTSRYAVGPFSLLMTAAFFSMSVASLALFIGLSRTLSGSARPRIGLALLGLWTVGLLLAMLFPLDPPGAPPTLAGTIHRLNGPLTFLCLAVGAVLISRRFKLDDNWRPLHRAALALALLTLALYGAGLLSLVAGAGVGGLIQRIMLVATVSWYLLTATRLRAIAAAGRAD